MLKEHLDEFIIAYLDNIIIYSNSKEVSRDTPVTPYTHPPVSTDSAIRDRSRDCRNLRQSTADRKSVV